MGSLVSSDPMIMLEGPTPATKKALKNAGMNASDIDLWEVNEAFAVIPMRLMENLNVDPSIVNVNGGAIAMGSPIRSNRMYDFRYCFRRIRAYRKKYRSSNIMCWWRNGSSNYY